MLIYPKEAIEKVGFWFEEDTRSKDWLNSNNYEELVELKVAVGRYPKAFEFLLVNKHVVLAAFVNAIWDDKRAFQVLMEKKEFHWAAMANLINGDVNAKQFLDKNNLAHYAVLALKIQARIRKDGDKSTSFFNSGPFKLEK
jgi:hypothetical protein